MAKINKLCVGESLVGEGNEIAHIDLLIGPRGSAAESAFANALQKDAASLKVNYDSITKPPYDIPNGNSMTTLNLPKSASGYKLERRIEPDGESSLIISYTLTNPAFDNPLIFERFSSIYLPAAGWCPPVVNP
jgi:hypothetical protein